MILLPAAVRILVWSEPVDMRRGMDSLAMIVRSVGEDLYSGHLYVFCSRRRHHLRILTWQRGGFVLLSKRLDSGRFRLPPSPDGSGRVVLDAAALALLLDGVDLATVKRPKHWEPRRPPPGAAVPRNSTSGGSTGAARSDLLAAWTSPP